MSVLFVEALLSNYYNIAYCFSYGGNLVSVQSAQVQLVCAGVYQLVQGRSEGVARAPMTYVF